MNWIRELCDLYEKNEHLVGIMEKGRYDESLVLLPVFHTTVAAQITVVIDEDGNFVRAERVLEENKMTIIPTTEKSAGRTSGVEPHPLCDNLKYLAGDYGTYVALAKDVSKNQKLYLEGLEAWAESPFSHQKVRAIWKYIKKGRLIQDLIEQDVLVTDENGQLSEKEKINKIDQREAFVRFEVYSSIVENPFESFSQNHATECWLDCSLHDSYISYCRSQKRSSGMSYLTGEQTAISYLHPKKIRNEGDGAKLISSNDETNFTFLGRFYSKEEAFAIGYEDSQKAHNALKWIIRKQGRSWNDLTMVTWESDLKEFPDWELDTDSLCQRVEAKWEQGTKEGNEEEYQGTNPLEAARFLSAVEGYKNRLDVHSRMILMAFDAATTGRLAMVECQQLASSIYLENIKRWHEDCGWLQPKYKEKKFYWYYGVAGVKDIANILYGSESKEGLTVKGDNKAYSQVCKRLLPCIVNRRNIPEDMVRLAVRKASSPESYESVFNWGRVLSLACSFVKKQAIERKDKEEWTVALNKESHDRNYLYGRLLAVADRIEYRTFEKDEKRETNAKRYMNAFSQRPFQTWKVIEERLQPYFMRLSIGERLSYSHLIEEICWLFEEGEFEKNKELSGLYLLGFHNQSYALRNKQEESHE